MTPSELHGWEAHFARLPAGDMTTHYLLASIWALMASWATRKPAAPTDVAPWLRVLQERPRRRPGAGRKADPGDKSVRAMKMTALAQIAEAARRPDAAPGAAEPPEVYDPPKSTEGDTNA